MLCERSDTLKIHAGMVCILQRIVRFFGVRQCAHSLI